MQANYVQRIRLVFGKNGYLRFIGHLDLARTLERAVNRARVPIAYTQGFNRRPRMQFADPLPLGFSSEGEIADLWLSRRVDPGEVHEQLSAVMPEGCELHSVSEVDLKEQPLQNQTLRAVYHVHPGDSLAQEDLRSRMDWLLNQPSISRQRRGKTYDLRPRIIDLGSFGGDPEPLTITMVLSLESGMVGRPDEVLSELDLDPLSARIHRVRIVLADEILY